MLTYVRGFLAAIGMLLLAVSVPTSAQATLYYFTQAEVGLGGNLPEPGYGSVDVTTVGADLKFDIQLAPNWSVDTGSHHAITFALTTGGLTVSGTSAVASALASPFVPVSGSGPFSNSPFGGPFNYAIDCNSSGTGANSCDKLSSLVFYVLGAGALSLVETNGVFIAADIFSTIPTNGATGVVGATLAAVPGPIAGAGLPGLILGCMGLLALARRRKAALIVT